MVLLPKVPQCLRIEVFKNECMKTIEFIGSFPEYRICPKDNKPEFAFIGRSNVGKSSLINMLTERKSLARVSKTPGKTQHLNFYLIDKEWYLVDLPGYGYAQTSKKLRRAFEIMIHQYLERRLTLQCTFVLIDIRIPPQAIDIDFINWLGANGIPFSIVFTKADKNNEKTNLENIEIFKAEMLKTWEALPAFFITSSETRQGKDELTDYIQGIKQQFIDYHS